MGLEWILIIAGGALGFNRIVFVIFFDDGDRQSLACGSERGDDCFVIFQNLCKCRLALVEAKKASFIAQYFSDFCQSKFLIFGLGMLEFEYISV